MTTELESLLKQAGSTIGAQAMITTESKPTTFTTGQVARWSFVSPATVHKWCVTGMLPHVRLDNGNRLIEKAVLLAFFRKHELPIPAELCDGN
jgi:hypothetical protein